MDYKNYKEVKQAVVNGELTDQNSIEELLAAKKIVLAQIVKDIEIYEKYGYKTAQRRIRTNSYLYHRVAKMFRSATV
jgi:hypothetical protein